MKLNLILYIVSKTSKLAKYCYLIVYFLGMIAI